MIDRARWNDRAVTFAEFSVGEGDAILDAFAESGRKGSRLMLVHSLRYADTGEPVFSSVADVEAVPFRHTERLTYLSARCSHLNGFGPDPDVELPGAQPNGHDTAPPPGPSL